MNKVTPSSLSPSFLYIGGMHGNEPLGRQLMVYLAEELCSQAGLPSGAADPEIDSILSSGSVHLLFALNPDGFDLYRRRNANKVDLNRNFPDPILRGGDLNRTGEEEPETVAIMDYAELLGSSLVGASELHEGALVVNYPFDGAASGARRRRVSNPSPDDKLYRYLAQRYIDVQPALVQGNAEFPTGKVQGSEWYPVYGGIQDYLYLRHSVYTTTIEMNKDKWPPESQLQQLWMQHRPSMYAFLKAYLCQGVTVQVDFPPGARKEDVVVSMLTPGMGRPTHFRDNVSHGVHYPVPAGTYSIGIDWGLGESKRSESLVATVESDKRTVLQVDARKVADSATTGKSGEKEKIAKLKMELERLSSIGTANERGSVVSEVAHLPFQMGGMFDPLEDVEYVNEEEVEKDVVLKPSEEVKVVEEAAQVAGAKDGLSPGSTGDEKPRPLVDVFEMPPGSTGEEKEKPRPLVDVHEMKASLKGQRVDLQRAAPAKPKNEVEKKPEKKPTDWPPNYIYPYESNEVTEGQGAGDQSLLDGVLLQAQNTAERIKSFNRSGLQIDIMSDSINLFAAILFGMGALCLLVYTVRRRYKEVTGDSGAEGRRGKRRRARQRSRSHQILI